MPARPRPISPHLTIYRWQIGNSLSILHRLTGVALSLGLAALCAWLIALAGGEAWYRPAARIAASSWCLALLVGVSFAFFYHLLNGIRHLLWDVGRGFERTARHASGWLAVLGALALTVCTWTCVWHLGRP